MSDETPLLSFEAVAKRFGGTLAVDHVSLTLAPGEILALLGENGAGKSTLIKMLAGIHVPDAGRILFRGTPYHHLRAAKGAERQHVAFIHQDLGLIDWMTVAENVALGVGYRRRRGLISWRGCRDQARQTLATMSADIDPETRIMHLSRTERSLVAIGRALAARAEVLVLDEPTASLPADEVAHLLGVLRDLRRTGIGMIYVSHRLDEVFDVADDVAVLRDGKLIGRRRVADTNPAELITMIVGRPPDEVATPVRRDGAPRLELNGFVAGHAGPVDLVLRAGEIVGLVGLRGAGQDVIGRALFGCRPIEQGSAVLDGRPYQPATPAAAMRAGIGLVAGDRVGESLGMHLSVRENLFLNPGARGLHPLRLFSPARERADARAAGASMSLRPNNPGLPVENLSGGNQQKVVLARWLGVADRVLILEEPTAGVDVGAKAEIYALLQKALEGGLSIILVATDFEEVAKICDRALVFSQGRVAGALDRDELSVGGILQAASAGGIAPSEAA